MFQAGISLSLLNFLTFVIRANKGLQDLLDLKVAKENKVLPEVRGNQDLWANQVHL